MSNTVNPTPPLYIRCNEYSEGVEFATNITNRSKPLIAIADGSRNNSIALATTIGKVFNKVADVVLFTGGGRLGFSDTIKTDTYLTQPTYLGPDTLHVFTCRRTNTHRYNNIEDVNDPVTHVKRIIGADNTTVSNTKPKPMALTRRIKALESANEDLRKENKTLKSSIDALQSTQPNPDNWSVDWKERLTLMVKYLWLERIPASNKASRALPDTWDYADTFASWPDKAKNDQWRVIKTMLDVLLNLDGETAGRRAHPFIRAGEKQPRLIDGCTLMRISVADRTPGAPRLSYITLPDGTIRFIDVTMHDDLL